MTDILMDVGMTDGCVIHLAYGPTGHDGAMSDRQGMCLTYGRTCCVGHMMDR